MWTGLWELCNLRHLIEYCIPCAHNPGGGGDLVSIMPICVCSKMKEMGSFLATSEWNEWRDVIQNRCRICCFILYGLEFSQYMACICMLKYQKWTTISVKINQINKRYWIINVIHRLLILTYYYHINGYKLCKGSIHYGYVLHQKVSFKIGPFSNPGHTHPCIFILDLPPGPQWMIMLNVAGISLDEI